MTPIDQEEYIDFLMSSKKNHEDILKENEQLRQEIAALRKKIEHLSTVEYCFNAWLEKTKWVQETSQPGELGLHYADVVRTRIEALQVENARLSKENTYALEMASAALDVAKQYQDKVIILLRGTAA